MQFDLKKIKEESVVPLAIVSGLAAGNVIYRAISSKVNPLVSTLILAAAGLLVAINVKGDFAKNTALAACAFGGLKLLNNVSAEATAGIDGIGDLGIALPDGVKSAIRKIFPTLNGDDDMQVIGMYDDMGTIDAEYQVVGPDDEFGSIDAEFGEIGEIGASDDLVLPKLNGSDIDVAGLDGRRNTGRFAAFKAKPNPGGQSRMLPARTTSPTANAAAVMRNRGVRPIAPGMRPTGGKTMNLTCQVAGLGEVSVDIA